MSESPKVNLKIRPENVELLKDKYNLDERTLTEIMRNIEFTTPVQGFATPAKLPDAETMEPTFLKALNKGEIGIGEAMVLLEYLDRKDRRNKEREANHPGISAKEIGKEVAVNVTSALRQVGLVGKTVGKEELPEWAQDIQKSNQEILDRMKGEEENKKLTAAVNQAVNPLKTQLEKAQEKIASLSGKAPTASPEASGPIERYIQIRTQLKEAGLLPEKTSGTIMMVNPDGSPMHGVPVEGKIPAWLVFGPAIAKQIVDVIETRVDKIARKYGLASSEEEKEEPSERKRLIKMPPKPKPKPKIQEKAETPKKEMEKPTSPPKKLLHLPLKSPAKKEPLKKAESPGENQLICAHCGKNPATLPNGLCEPCSRELARLAESESSVEPIEEEETEKEADKQYFCDACGAGPFSKPWEKATHVKNCEKAKKAKAEKEGAESA